MQMRDKTKNAIPQHLSSLNPSDTCWLLGDSHVERFVWKHPDLAPENTWICGVGGDTIARLLWRIENDEGTGYATCSEIKNNWKSILILVGTNDIKPFIMRPDQFDKLVDGISAIVSILRKRWSSAAIAVLPLTPVPPSGHTERHPSNVEAFNKTLIQRGLADASLKWDLDEKNDFADHVHMNVGGYQGFLRMLDKCDVKVKRDIVDPMSSQPKRSAIERRISILQKKLDRIGEIEKTIQAGENVEETQRQMLEREEEIKEELRALREW